MPLKLVFLRPRHWSRLKPRLLKHDCRRQGGSSGAWGTQASELKLVSLVDKRAVKPGFVKGSFFGECTLVPDFVLGEHANVPSFRFSFQGNIRMYPRSGKTTLLRIPKIIV